MAQAGFGRTPLGLIVDGAEDTVRALERLLSANDYAVLKAYSKRQAIRLLERVRPDLLLVGDELPDGDGCEFIATARRESGLRASTPALLVTAAQLNADARARAYANGSWGIISLPLNEAEVVPQLRSLVRAKQDADAAREESLVDPDTGLYNVRGILRRVAEATADAERHGRPVTCVALGLDRESDSPSNGRLSEEFAAQLASAIRGADTAGRIGDADFIVLAPGTDPDGASRLAERLLQSVEPLSAAGAGVDVRAGYSTFQRSEDATGFIPVDLLTRATLALRRAQETHAGSRVRSYEA